jgi:hypothetical protein
MYEQSRKWGFTVRGEPCRFKSSGVASRKYAHTEMKNRRRKSNKKPSINLSANRGIK